MNSKAVRIADSGLGMVGGVEQIIVGSAATALGGGKIGVPLAVKGGADAGLNLANFTNEINDIDPSGGLGQIIEPSTTESAPGSVISLATRAGGGAVADSLGGAGTNEKAIIKDASEFLGDTVDGIVSPGINHKFSKGLDAAQSFTSAARKGVRLIKLLRRNEEEENSGSTSQ